MYKELLDEAGMNKKYDKDIIKDTSEIEELKRELVEKNNFVAFTRRLILVFEYVLFSLLFVENNLITLI